MTAFCIVSGLLFMFLFVIWNGRDDRFNLFIKLFFGCMMVWAIACALTRLGFHS